MYLYRALSEDDRIIDPKNNGIFSKEIINECINSAFDIYKRDSLKSLNEPANSCVKNFKINKEELLKAEFLISELNKKANKNQECIKQYAKYIMEENEKKYYEFLELIKSTNSHILTGSRTSDNWISLSTSLEAIRDYFNNQYLNNVAIIEFNITESRSLIFEAFGNELLMVNNLSTEEAIKNNQTLCTKDGKKTNINCMAMNYAKKSKEVLFYNRIPKEKVVTIIDAFAYELMTSDVINQKYLTLTDDEKLTLKERLLKSIQSSLKQGDNLIDYILTKHYYENYSLAYIESILQNNSQNKGNISDKSSYNKISFEVTNANNIIIDKAKILVNKKGQ